MRGHNSGVDDCGLITNYKSPLAPTPSALLQWVLHNSCATSCILVASCCTRSSTPGRRLRGWREGATIHAPSPGGWLPGHIPSGPRPDQRNQSGQAPDHTWLIRYATHFVFLVQFDQIGSTPKYKPSETTKRQAILSAQGGARHTSTTWGALRVMHRRPGAL